MRSRSLILLAGLALLPAMTFAQQDQRAADFANEPDQEPAEVAPQPRTHTIFQAAQAPEGATGLRHNRGLFPVTVDMTTLDSVRPGDTIRFEAAPGSFLDLEVTRRDVRADDRYTLFARVRNAPHSIAILVREEDALAGNVRLPLANLHYKMKYAGTNAQGQVVHFVNDVDDNRYGNCGGATPVPADADDRGFDPVPEAWELSETPVPPTVEGFGERGSCSNIAPVWDVMVVYTNVARAAIGGTTAMNAEVQLGVDTANTTFDNSNVNARYRLVYRGEITYNESGSMGDHRDRLRDPDDNFFDSVNILRDNINADMCSIWVDDNDGGDTCGIAFCDVSADAAYVCVNWDCAVSNFTYPHEHGHGQGCAHNPDDAGSGCNEFSYSYGHRWQQGTNFYRTVMAYNTDNGPYTRIGYWSNPGINFNGLPTGTATRDNARTLDDTARSVENFEPSGYDVWIDQDPVFPAIQLGSYSYPFMTAAQGVGAIEVPNNGASERPNLRVITGTYPYTGTITKQMNILTCGGPATIGTP